MNTQGGSFLRTLDRWINDPGPEFKSSPWMRWVVSLAPVLLIVAWFERGIPSQVTQVLRALVGACYVLLVLQSLAWCSRPGGVREFARRFPFRTWFHALQVPTWIALVVVGRHGTAAASLLVTCDLIGRGYGRLTLPSTKPLRPARILILSFLLMIGAGTVLLQMDGVCPDGGGLNPADAFFMSTSAVCVTGLSVLDVGSELTWKGQAVLLVLIQLGGLGLMTLGALVLLFLDKGRRSRGSAAVGDVLGTRPGDTLRLAGAIVFMTFVLEGLGAIALGYATGDPWLGTFASISAFCNAGFFPSATSLEGYRGHYGVNAVVMLLIVLGGLGFPVILELWSHVSARLKRKPLERRTSLLTRLVLASTLVLIVLGGAVYYALERERSLQDLPEDQRLLASLFHSVSMRTAGFNTVPFSAGPEAPMAPATLVFTTGMMSIGANPLGTGGGFKTVTLAILLLGIFTVMRGHNDTVVSRRRISRSTTTKAAAVFTLYTMTLFVIVVMLLVFEGERFSLGHVLFEASSALGTVGLSTGITAELGHPGRWVLCLAMFLGRVGPLTMFLLWSEARSTTVSYPEEELLVG